MNGYNNLCAKDKGIKITNSNVKIQNRKAGFVYDFGKGEKVSQSALRCVPFEMTAFQLDVLNLFFLEFYE